VTLQELYKAAVADANSGQYSEAIRKLELILTHEIGASEKANICALLGAVYLLVGKNEQGTQRLVEALAVAPNHAEAWKNLSEGLRRLDRLDEAVEASRKVLTLKPDYVEAHNNIGNLLYEQGKFDDAIASYCKALMLKPNYAEAHHNMGMVLKDQGMLDDAIVSYRKALSLKENFAEAHNSMGGTLRKLGRLDEAEASYRQAIKLKGNFAEYHNNLGVTLKELDRLEEAKKSYRRAIELESNFAEVHTNLGIVLHACGEIESAIESLKKSYDIDSNFRYNDLLLKVLRAKKIQGKTMVSVGNIGFHLRSTSKIIISNRAVEPELVATLKKIQSREMDKSGNTPVYGNGRCSLDYSMFNEDLPVIKSVESNLINIMETTVNSEVYVDDSFFNIYGAGSGIRPHTHINKLDEEKYLNLENQKYSLVYYLSVGDQDCSEPGILKFYEPEEEILPCDGMIVTFLAGRQHSTIYNGKKDRIIMGVNFYSL
jgi:tetratricopeptide (TPR) repeat protein